MPLYGNSPRFITTIKDAWLVIIKHPEKGNSVTRTFRPQTKERLKEAEAWRNETYEALYGHPIPERVFHSSSKVTATGIPGVRFVLKKVKKKKTGKIYEVPAILAEIHTIPGKDYERARGSKSKIYSLNKYDWDEAISLATAWREAMIKEYL